MSPFTMSSNVKMAVEIDSGIQTKPDNAGVNKELNWDF